MRTNVYGESSKALSMINSWLSSPSLGIQIISDEVNSQRKSGNKKLMKKLRKKGISLEELIWDYYVRINLAREEAENTWELGKKLGLKMKGTEDAFKEQVEDLVIKDMDKMANKKKDNGERKKIPMKILTYNIRGLGQGIKKKETSNLIKGLHTDFCCIQETKFDQVNNHLCRALWGIGNIDWVHRNSEGMVVVNGIWKEDGSSISIVNIYAPNIAAERWRLWDTLQILSEQYKYSCFCIVCDFNSIRSHEERRGRRVTWDKRDMERFNDFISQSDMTDLYVIGRTFT
ncbi:hypothetical protein ACS0TY_006120 [Phlomoides rotata]